MTIFVHDDNKKEKLYSVMHSGSSDGYTNHPACIGYLFHDPQPSGGNHCLARILALVSAYHFGLSGQLLFAGTLFIPTQQVAFHFSQCPINAIDEYEDDFYNEPFYSDYYIFIILDLLMNALSAACALGVRHILRLHEVEIQLEEMKHKSMEAELVWLKNQLNPHFLFNTLNNISSLVYIDADQAQDSITKLSDLLRYALYESSKAEVSLFDEVDFMQNYISLMKLRCSDKVKVETHFDLSQPSVKIAPMLFISVLENAFKHGVSTHQTSFIHASLCVNDDNIVFTCDNSNFPKKDKNLSGGVGIENTQRRLELLYPQRSEYVHTLQDDIYHVEIKIKL